MKKNVLITGASGFIGSFMAEEGVNRNYQVYAAVRPSSSRQYLTNDNIRIIILTLHDKPALIKEFRKLSEDGIHFHYIIHNAGVTKALHKNDFLKVNYEYTRNLIEALQEGNSIPDKFLYISSLEAMGPGDGKTLKPIHETDAPHPLSLYGKSKLKSEQYLESLKNFPHIILRPTGVYGPREKDYLVYIKAIKRGFEFYLGRKKQHLSFIYVKDLARVAFLALESEIANRTYFVTDGNTYTSNDLANTVKEIISKKCLKIIIPKFVIRWMAYLIGPAFALFNKQTILNPDKYKALISANWLCDSTNLKRDFHFEARYHLKDGLQETIEWYKARRWI